MEKLEAAAAKGADLTAEQAIALLEGADDANGSDQPLVTGILLATPTEWRAVVSDVLNAIRVLPNGRHALQVIFAWGRLYWQRGYDAGHTDAIRGRHVRSPAGWN